ncbi:centromere-associated protein E-like [Copidosoma floridanum]|uniref:centromere-associated protein E-like n=1 Tax=Copidosoma floridanum TaxID=29053 RepID=UPI0006C97EC7|nr:centromere-associated protein E-like [Copidosoma floridanum]
MSRRDDLRLDKRFDDLVHQLRPYALRLQSDDSRLCRLWLDRLDKAEEQRNLRNEYLFELYKQLKMGYLRPPFHKPPESGKLMPLSKLHRLILSSSCNELTETSPGSPCQPRPTKHLTSPGKRSKSLVHHDNVRRRSFIPKRCDSSSPARSAVAHGFLSPTVCEPDNRNLLRTYKERIETLGTIVEELESQNNKLKQKLDHYHKNSGGPDEVAQLYARIKQLVAEIDTLKNELSKVNDIKEKLKTKHNEIVERYKAQMSEQVGVMKQQLDGAQGENRELRDKIAEIELKLQEAAKENIVAKSSDKDWKDKLESVREQYERILAKKEEEIKRRDELVQRKELELAKKLDEIEALSMKMNELQQGLESKSQEDSRLQSMLQDQYNEIKDELIKMRSNIESSSLKQNENYHQQISVLMKHVEKLKNHTRKLKEDYNRKIYHIVKENEKVVSDLKMRLKAKCAKPLLLDRYNNCETDSEPGFERNYKKFLENLAKSADNQRSKYYEKLSFLDDQIGCHLHHR